MVFLLIPAAFSIPPAHSALLFSVVFSSDG